MSHGREKMIDIIRMSKYKSFTSILIFKFSISTMKSLRSFNCGSIVLASFPKKIPSRKDSSKLSIDGKLSLMTASIHLRSIQRYNLLLSFADVAQIFVGLQIVAFHVHPCGGYFHFNFFL